jgi:hypothetical protein
MILQQILHNTPQYPYTVITDDANAKCYTPFLLFKVINAQQTSHRILCITSDVVVRKPLYRKFKSVIHNISTISIDSIDQLLQSIHQFLNKFDNDDIPTIVIVDSLSSIVMQYGFSEGLRFIETLQQYVFNHTTSIDSVVAVIHSDVHAGATVFDDEVNALKLRATGTIEIIDAHEIDSTRSYFFGEADEEEKVLDKKQIHFKCDLTSMRQRSKLLSHEEFYKVLSEDDCVISHVKHPFIPKKKKTAQITATTTSTATNQQSDNVVTTATSEPTPAPKKDIKSQVPFKIGLTPKEQEDRNRVVLPYVQQGRSFDSNQQVLPQQKQNKGFIIVDTNSDDDEYDSDDPDADLDI